MTDGPAPRATTKTVPPWQSLASLGVIESDLTTTRHRPAPAPYPTDGRPGHTSRHGRRERA
ncbi:hypothetical protein [Streptomyces indicus]|uniref:Uncharacterized protein n=1 Tax=Streptomyces indicus TaxID=417292 RepID=A0A1G9J2S6_9ACTN|nr:hypothetical protein [Streptomyces indicus]SDL31780.1 hypothetical protein SAMN05421806_12715 [Streptomyces indicus]